jgi:hypothetical protein
MRSLFFVISCPVFVSASLWDSLGKFWDETVTGAFDYTKRKDPRPLSYSLRGSSPAGDLTL